MAVLDASVLTGLLNRADRFHPVCRAWFEQAIRNDLPLLAPAIAPSETCAALRRGADDPDLAEAALDELFSAALVELVPIDLGMARQAADIAIAQEIRGCGAIYVALARREGMPLVTLDRQQGRRAAAVVEVTRPDLAGQG